MYERKKRHVETKKAREITLDRQEDQNHKQTQVQPQCKSSVPQVWNKTGLNFVPFVSQTCVIIRVQMLDIYDKTPQGQ